MVKPSMRHKHNRRTGYFPLLCSTLPYSWLPCCTAASQCRYQYQRQYQHQHKQYRCCTMRPRSEYTSDCKQPKLMRRSRGSSCCFLTKYTNYVMLYYTILYHTVLYYAIRYYTTLHQTIRVVVLFMRLKTMAAGAGAPAAGAGGSAAAYECYECY